MRKGNDSPIGIVPEEHRALLVAEGLLGGDAAEKISKILAAEAKKYPLGTTRGFQLGSAIKRAIALAGDEIGLQPDEEEEMKAVIGIGKHVGGGGSSAPSKPRGSKLPASATGE